MGFITRLERPEVEDCIPVLPYVHELGFKELFKGSVDLVDLYGKRLVRENEEGIFSPTRVGSFDFAVMVLWGRARPGYAVERMADVIGHRDFKKLSGEEWKRSNPTAKSFQYRDKRQIPADDIELCGDVNMLLGAIEGFRRGTDSLEDFVRITPDPQMLDLMGLFGY